MGERGPNSVRLFALVRLVHSQVMTEKSQTDNQSKILFHRNAIYKKPINNAYERKRKATTMSRSYDLEIRYVINGMS